MSNGGQERPALRFRAAREEDHAQVVELTREIWEGEDYLPHVWHEWVHAPQSFLEVGLLGEEIVATGRVVELTPGGWWLEGLRVHPKHQGKGFATVLHHHMVEVALRQPGLRVLGLATSSENPQVAHLARSTGMTLRGEYRFFKGGAAREAVEVVAPFPNANVDALWARVASSNWLRLTGGYAMDGWVARPMDPAWLAEICAAGGVWQCGEALALAGGGSHEGQAWLYLLDGGSAAEQEALVRHARHLAFEEGHETFLRCFAPLDEGLQGPLLAAGLHDPEDGEFHIFHFVREVGPDGA